MRKAFEAYWERGGFPEVAGLERALRIRIHQEYWGAMLFRDLVERHDVAHPRSVSDLAHRLVDNIASLYSVNRLTAYLQSLGHRAPKSAVADYVAWFEDAFFLFTVRVFDASLARANANPKKIYCPSCWTASLESMLRFRLLAESRDGRRLQGQRSRRGNDATCRPRRGRRRRSG